MQRVFEFRPSVLATALMLVVLLAFSPTTLAGEKGRGAVKDFEFAFEPSPSDSAGVPSLKICVLPLINSNDLEHHTKNLEKATRNLSESEIPRVLGIRFNSGGKPLNRFLTPQPFESTIQGALEAELRALGMDVMPPMDGGPLPNFRERTLVAMADELPEDGAPDLLMGIEIDDFFFETTTGMWKLKMETFFVLEVVVFDMASREIVWEGTVEAGDLEKKAMFMGKEAVETRLHATFQDLIEGVLRNNSDLQGVLTDLG